MTVDGQGIGAAETFEVLAPATETVIARVPDASHADLDAAVTAA